jgi:hypothetical protein
MERLLPGMEEAQTQFFEVNLLLGVFAVFPLIFFPSIFMLERHVVMPNEMTGE